jgi:hypothetical protein
MTCVNFSDDSLQADDPPNAEWLPPRNREKIGTEAK